MDSKISFEKILDEAISGVKADLISHQTEAPAVRYDPKEKKISVTHGFEWGRIVIKIIAPREVWLGFWNELDPELVTFETVEPYLSRPSKEVRKKLKEYAQELPDHFGGDFFVCVMSANAHNPLCRTRVKPRKPSPYNFSWSEMNEVKATAAYLYVYLDHIRKKPAGQRPKSLDKLLEAYEVLPVTLETDLIEAVRIIIAGYYGFAPSADRFYKSFITESAVSLERLRNMKLVKTDNNPFLEPIFAEFKD